MITVKKQRRRENMILKVVGLGIFIPGFMMMLFGAFHQWAEGLGLLNLYPWSYKLTWIGYGLTMGGLSLFLVYMVLREKSEEV